MPAYHLDPKSRLSLSLRSLFNENVSRFEGTRGPAGAETSSYPQGVENTSSVETIPVLIVASDERTVQKALATTEQSASVLAPGLLSADLNPEGIRCLYPLLGVEVDRIERMVVHRPQLDRALPAAGFVPSPSGESELQPDGSGTLIGIIDTGFDLSHPAFRDRNGHLRVDALLVQEQGRQQQEYSTSDLENAWASGRGPGSDTDGHGTHVASIAGGSPFAGIRGIAPGARFILVKTDFVRIVPAYEWIFRQSRGRPCVVNCSFGHHDGAHDGTSIEELEGPRILSGNGKILVAAAGNSGMAPVHCSGYFDEGRVREFPFSIDPDASVFRLSLWYSNSDEFQIDLISPTGQSVDCPSVDASDVRAQSGTASVHFLHGHYYPSPLIQLQLNIRFPFRGGDPKDYATWRLRVRAHRIVLGRVDTWITNQNSGVFNENPLLHQDCTLLMPATSQSYISVGSYVSAVRWKSDAGEQISPTAVIGKISRFSSKGPTLDGREAPDVCAPGQYLAAALSSQCRRPHERVVSVDRLLVLEGTSMAAPVVSGLISLMLQKKTT